MIPAWSGCDRRYAAGGCGGFANSAVELRAFGVLRVPVSVGDKDHSGGSEAQTCRLIE